MRHPEGQFLLRGQVLRVDQILLLPMMLDRLDPAQPIIPDQILTAEAEELILLLLLQIQGHLVPLEDTIAHHMTRGLLHLPAADPTVQTIATAGHHPAAIEATAMDLLLVEAAEVVILQDLHQDPQAPATHHPGLVEAVAEEAAALQVREEAVDKSKY